MTTTTPRKPTIQKSNLDTFAREGESIIARNTQDTITVFVAKIDGNEEISEFGPKGDPHGGDVMEIPSKYLKNAQFRKILRKGIIEIIDGDNPDVVTAFEADQASWAAQQSAKHESDQFLDQQQVRAFSGVQCIAQEGRGTCAEFAISAQKNNREKPPLCSKHAYLAGQYTPEETGRFVEGKPEIHWNRVSIQSGR